MAFWKQLLVKISEKLGATMQRIPNSLSAHAAASRDEPQPKLSHAIRIEASRYGTLFRTKSGLSDPSSKNRMSLKRWAPNPVRLNDLQ
jgi:hypothetical protein